MAFIMASVMTVGSFGVNVSAAPNFADMPNDWSTTALQNAVDNGLISGYDEGGQRLIKPQGSLTRAEMATIVNNAFGATEEANISGVSDVSSSDWFAPQISKAVAMGTFAMDTSMRPNDKITRQEAFAVLARAYKLSGTGSVSALSSFADAADVASWAQGDVAALVSKGYVAGNNGRLNPTDYITRAEFAQIMNTVTSKYVTAAGDFVGGTISGNLMVKASGAVIKDTVVNGDLIIGDGVGNGEVTLENVTVSGRTIVRGGGPNSIIARGLTRLANVLLARRNGPVRLRVEGEAQVGAVVADESSQDVAVTGKVDSLTVNSEDTNVSLAGAEVGTLTVAGAGTTLTSDASTNIGTLAVEAENSKLELAGTINTITNNAENSSITIADGATVTQIVTNSPSTVIVISGTVTTIIVNSAATATQITVTSSGNVTTIEANGAGTTVSGEGKVDTVLANADNVKVDTEGTKVTAAEGVEGVTAGGATVPAGSTVTTQGDSGSSNTTRPGGGGSSSSSSSTSSSYDVKTDYDSKQGTVTLSNTKYRRGASVTFTVKANEGYEVDKVTVKRSNTEVNYTDNGDGTYTFTMPGGSVTITVTFKETAKDPVKDPETETFAVKFDGVTVENGSMTVSAGGKEITSGTEVEKDTKVTLKFTPVESTTGEGYTWDTTSVVKANTDTLTVTNNEASFTVTADTTITVTGGFREKVEGELEPSLKLSGDLPTGFSANSVKVDYTQPLKEGDSVTVTITPVDGYTFKVNGKALDSTGKVTLTASDNGSGVFEINVVGTKAQETPTTKATLTFPSEVENGTMTVSVGGKNIASGDEVEAGALVTITVSTTAENAVFTGTVTAGTAGGVGINGGKGEFTMPATATTITVTGGFETVAENEVIIDVKYTTCPSGFTVTTSPTGKVEKGGSVEVTVPSVANYTFTVNGTAVPTNGKVTLTVPADASGTFTITVVGTATVVEDGTVTISTATNGTVTATVDGKAIASGDKVAAGKTVTVTATPDSGYELNKVTVTGATYNETAKTFTMPEGKDVTISATFKEEGAISVNLTTSSEAVTATLNKDSGKPGDKVVLTLTTSGESLTVVVTKPDGTTEEVTVSTTATTVEITIPENATSPVEIKVEDKEEN